MCTVPYNTHYYIWIYITTHTLLLRKKYNMTSYTYVGNSLSTFSTEGKQNTSPYLWETNVKSSTACCCITTRYHLRIFQQLSYFKRSLADQRLIKVHIFWEGHKILRNLHLTFDYSTYSQKLGEDFATFCGLLRIYEL